ncbi:MAG: hypothetical protein NVV74_11490 [Magnetospirillum sp.]|nr:hypothetical protein [Magnetospirillum sp.]
MPLSLPRRSLAVEIAVSLVVKAAALAVLGFVLFGPDDRPPPSPPPLLGERP